MQENYMVIIDGQEKGPFTVEEIHSMITEGSLDYSHLAWQEGFEDWTPITEIPDLVKSKSMNDVEDAKPPPKKTHTNATFAEKFQTSAKLAAAQANLMKLERIDLCAALSKLGQAVYEHGFVGAGLQRQYDAINEIRCNIETLKKEPAIAHDAGIAEKTKRILNKGKRALEIVGLLPKQKALFREIGEAIISFEEVPSELEQHLDDVHLKQRKIEELTIEIETLRSKVSGVFTKPGRVLSVVALVIMLLLTWNFIMLRDESGKAGTSEAPQIDERENANLTSRYNQEGQEAKEKRKLEIYSIVREYTEKRLLSPGSAVWPGLDKISINDNPKSDRSASWSVVGYVDSQNSFGALVRTEYKFSLIPKYESSSYYRHKKPEVSDYIFLVFKLGNYSDFR